MKHRALSILAAPSFLFFLWSVVNARADYYLDGWESQREDEKVLALVPELTGFSSTKNISPSGVAYLPSQLQSYSRLQWNTAARYGVTSQLTLFGRLALTRVEVSPSTAPNGGEKVGLGDQMLGLNYKLSPKSDPTDISGAELQIRGDLPAYKNSSSKPALGNQSFDVSIGGFLGIPIYQEERARWGFTPGMGYMFRSGSIGKPQPLFLWSAIFRRSPLEDGILLSAGVVSAVCLNANPQENSPISILSPSGSGGSYITNSDYPRFIRGVASVGYQWDPKVSLEGRIATDLQGSAIASGTQWSASVTYRWDWSGSKPPESQTPAEYGKSNQGFVDYSGDAKVIGSDERSGILQINRGSENGIEPGQVFDLFSTRPNGDLIEVVARARVQSVQGKQATLKVTEYYREVWVENGFIAKRPVLKK